MYEHERSLVQRMTNRPFALIGVNSDPPEKIFDALERENITWRSFSNGGSTRGPISQAWGVNAWPTIYVLDHEGVIRYKNVRGEAMDAATDPLVEHAIQAVAAGLESSDPAVRGLAAFRMGRYAVPDAVAAVSPLLDDPDAVVQQRAATGLALLGQPVQPLLAKIRAAASDADPDVRAASLELLGEAKDVESLPLALHGLEDGIGNVRRAALHVLGAVGDAAVVPAVAKLLDDPKSRMGREAAEALAAMGLPESVELLKTLAARADHPARVWIVEALHRVDPEQTGARVSELMADQDAQTRRRTARMVTHLEGFDPTDLFIKALADADQEVSRSARTFLATSSLPRAREALQQYYTARLDELIPLLSGADAAARNRAQSDIFSLGPEVASMLMQRLLQVEDKTAFSLLSTVVAALRNPDVLPEVVTQLGDANLDENRRVAFEGFIRFFSDQLVPAAVDLSKRDEPVLRLSGARMLSMTLDDRAGPVLKSLLADTDPRVRVAAAVGLSRQKAPEALTVLQELVTHSDRAVLGDAIRGLANYAEESGLPPIEGLLASEDPAVRVLAFTSLGSFKSAKVTALIVQRAAEDEHLERLAPRVLGLQGTTDAAHALGEYLKGDDPQMRQLAEQSLGLMSRVPVARTILQEYRKQREEEKARAGSEQKSE